MNSYAAFYSGKETTVKADTSYAAQLKAIEFFKPSKAKKHLVHVHLLEVAGQIANVTAN